MIYDWQDSWTPRGRLFDKNENEITLLVFWCDTETGMCKYYVQDANGKVKIIGGKPVKASKPFPAPLRFEARR